MAINNFKCEKCGRNMGDIDEPICHQCEQYEIDEAEKTESQYHANRFFMAEDLYR